MTILMAITFALFVAFVVAGIVYFYSGNGPKKKRPRNQVVRKKLFRTDNESEFLSRLEKAAPEVRFHCQVSMGALMDPVTQGHEANQVRWRYASKIVDYVAEHKQSGRIVLIELDDRTHDPEKDRFRDALTSDAGYTTLRWNSRSKPDAATIRSTLFSALKEAA